MFKVWNGYFYARNQNKILVAGLAGYNELRNFMRNPTSRQRQSEPWSIVKNQQEPLHTKIPKSLQRLNFFHTNVSTVDSMSIDQWNILRVWKPEFIILHPHINFMKGELSTWYGEQDF